MRRIWRDWGLIVLGFVVMDLGIIFPIYLFHEEGTSSSFGSTVFVVAGILLFVSGLGITLLHSALGAARQAPE